MKSKNPTTKCIRNSEATDYRVDRKLDLANNRWAVVLMNLLAAVGLFLYSGIALWVLWRLRPDAWVVVWIAMAWLAHWGPWVALLTIVLLYTVMVVVHEALHGVGFWLFTRERPRFGLHLPSAAYAAAPDWLLTRHQHLIVGLAPLTVITLGGSILLAYLPPLLAAAALFIVVINATGSVGDLLMVAWLLRQPRDVLVQDTGSAITTYRPR